MDLSTEFLLQIAVYITTIGLFAGSINTRIKSLEKKQDQHNEFMKRIARLEGNDRTTHYRIKNIQTSIMNIEKIMKELERRDKREN